MSKVKNILREKRKKRVRAKIRGTTTLPRLSVFRSNKYIYTQIINDESGKTLFAAGEKELGQEVSKKETKIERAKKVGQFLAQKAKAQKIKEVAFDRGSYKYHGRVKALAEGAREGGLVF